MYEKTYNTTNHMRTSKQDTTLYLLGWLFFFKITSTFEDAQKLEHLYTVNGNVKWCGHHGK
jgi:hypothetical protein